MSSTDGRPVSILKITPEKVSIDVPALKEILKKVDDSPFAVYSINGPKRTGKSFMLSQCIRYLAHFQSQSGNSWLKTAINENTFEWRGGSERTTTGIDVWSEPFWVEQNNRKVALILMDTQGSFDDDTTLQQNAIVFAISTLLSSVLIYNIMRDIDEAMLQFLHFFSNFATMTIPGDEKNQSGGAFQKLIFLIRDFQFVQDYKYGFYDSQTAPAGQNKNYKKDKVDSKPSQQLEVRYTHDQVTSSFRDIEVYLMPEPDKGLKQRDQIDNMDEDFAEHLVNFVNLLLSQKVVTKKIGGFEVTGNDMIKYISVWKQLFDGQDLPEIKSIYHSTADAQYIMAKHMAITYYTSEMQKYIQNSPDGIPEEKITKISEECCLGSKKIFQSRRRMGGKEYDDKFEEEFEAESERLLQTFKSTNNANLKADRIRKDMDEENKRIAQEIQNAKEEMTVLKDQHEQQRQDMQKQISNGNKKAEDLVEMVKAQEAKQEDINRKIKEKEEEIEKVRREAKEMREEQNSELKVFAKVGEYIDDIVLAPLKLFGKLFSK